MPDARAYERSERHYRQGRYTGANASFGIACFEMISFIAISDQP